MTFEGQYLTYAEYINLGGSAIGEMPFNILEFEARRQIDLRTYNRLKDKEDIPQEVKMCEYALINRIKEFAETNARITSSGNLKSETIDGYSIQYISASEVSDVVKSKNSEVEDIIKTYLLGVIVNGEHVMYIGVE